MLCAEFEDRLTDYLDGALEGETNRAFGEHALRCPVCHELLNEVRNAIVECRADVPPQPAPGLEARILLKTAPETAMRCEEFEEHLTDYLDGFLPATLYHRWERHAALCDRCSDLPGQVVRATAARRADYGVDARLARRDGHAAARDRGDDGAAGRPRRHEHALRRRLHRRHVQHEPAPRFADLQLRRRARRRVEARDHGARLLAAVGG